MWRSATIVSPLRSKRAMISPVRPRAKASGLTRIRFGPWVPLAGGLGTAQEVGSRRARPRAARAAAARRSLARIAASAATAGSGSVLSASSAASARRSRARARARRRRAPRGSTLDGRGGAPAAARAGRCEPGHLGLAVGADRPRLVERARAADAALLELAQAARAADEVALDAVVAVRAQRAGRAACSRASAACISSSRSRTSSRYSGGRRIM